MTRRLHLAVLALVAALGPILFFVPLFLPVPLFVLAILGGAMLFRAGSFDPWRPLRTAPLLALLLAWAALSFLWTAMPAKTVPDALRAAALFYAGLLLVDAASRLDARWRGLLLRAAAWGLVAAAAAVLVHVWSGGRAAGYSRGATLAGALAVPLALGLWRVGQRALAVGVLIFAVAAVLSLHNLAAKTAFAAAALVGGIAIVAPRLVRLLALAIPAAMLAFPLLVAQLPDARANCDLLARKTSIVHRMAIWSYTTARIAEHPALGSGMNSAKAMPPQHIDLFEHCPDLPGAAALRDQVLLMPLHPHNNLLQLWLELGAVGLALGLAQLAWLAWRAAGAAPDRFAAGAVLGAAAGLGVVASVSFGLWQSWWLAGAMLVAALAALAAGRLDGAQPGA